MAMSWIIIYIRFDFTVCKYSHGIGYMLINKEKMINKHFTKSLRFFVCLFGYRNKSPLKMNKVYLKKKDVAFMFVCLKFCMFSWMNVNLQNLPLPCHRWRWNKPKCLFDNLCIHPYFEVKPIFNTLNSS